MSIVRGRGWAQHDNSPLPRPGRCPQDVDTASLTNIINGVSNSNVEEKAKEVLKSVSDKGNNENIKNIHDKLYKHAMNNREFGPKLIMVYRSPVFKEHSKGSVMWKHLVYSLQADYERKEQLKQENATYFYNVVRLFSQFLYQSESTLSQLFLALLEYMEMLLKTASMDDIKLFTELIVIHGKYMADYFREQMDELMINVRKTLVQENVSLTSRQMLLYTVDLVHYNCDPLPKNLQEFYEQILGKNFILRINNNGQK